MQTKTIKVGNTKEKEGKYGPSLQVGVNEGGSWTNFFVNKPELFEYFQKGKTVTVEYEVKGDWNIIKGVAPDTQKSEGGRDATGRSIELQVIAKCYAEMYAAKNEVPTPLTFAESVVESHAIIFADPLTTAVEKVKEALDAEEIPYEDDIPFGD